jgi:hypothetical protein
MRLTIISALLLFVTGFATSGSQGPDAEKRAAAIATLLDDQSFGVAHFDLGRADADELVALFAGVAPSLMDPLSDFSVKNVKDIFGKLRKLGAKELYAVYSFADGGKQPVFAIPLVADAQAKGMIDLLTEIVYIDDLHAEKIGNLLVFGTKAACQRSREIKPGPRPELAKAFAAAGDKTAQLLLVPTPLARRAFEEIIPILPPEIGGGPSTVLTHNVDWIAIGANGTPNMAIRAVVHTFDEPKANAVAGWLTQTLKKLGQVSEVKKLWPNFDEITTAVKLSQSRDRVVLELNNPQATALLTPLADTGRGTAQLKKAMGSLKRLGLSMHEYCSVNKGYFPTPASYDKQGKPLLSWRVLVLPYLGHRELYKEFKLDEPWDSAHNLKLVAKMPKVYWHPEGLSLREGKTPFLLPVGDATIFPGGKAVNIGKDITDGTSNTVMIFEAADDHMVVWTRPEDLPFDEKQPQRGLIDKNRSAFAVALADGSTHTFQNSIPAATLKALITRNGGEVVQIPD